jgi:hypothetical protein
LQRIVYPPRFILIAGSSPVGPAILLYTLRMNPDILWPEYESFCEEHDLKLDERGCCDLCRDKDGNKFPLDMQSIYLKKKFCSGRQVV